MPTATSMTGRLNPYLHAAAPLVIVAMLAPLLELALRHPLGDQSAGQIATGVAAIPGGLLAAKLAQQSRGRDAVSSRRQMSAGAGWTSGDPNPTDGEPSAATRRLLIVVAALGFMFADFAAMLIGYGIYDLWPTPATTYTAFYNAIATRSIVIFFLGCVFVATTVALRMRVNTRSALAASVAIYVAGNSLQNILMGGELDALFFAWTLGYIVAAALAIHLGTRLASRRQGAFDAVQRVRTGKRH